MFTDNIKHKTKKELLEIIERQNRILQKNTTPGVLNTALKAAGFGFCLVSQADNMIVFTDSLFDEIFGYEPGQLTGQHVVVLNGKDHPSRLKTAADISETLAAKGYWQGRVNNVTRQGNEFETWAVIEHCDDPVYGPCWLTVQKKLSATDLLELELEKSEGMSRALFEAVPDLVFYIDKDGTFLDYKAERAELYQQKGSMIGQNFHDTLPPELVSLVDLHIKKALQKKSLHEFNYTLEIPGKGERYYESRMVPYGESKLVVFVRDITDRHEHEKALIESESRLKEALELKEQILSVVAHDLRGPLGVISSVIDIFNNGIDLQSEMGDRLFKNLEQLTATTMNMLENLLTWNRVERMSVIDREEIDLHRLLNDSVLPLFSEAAKLKEISLENNIPPGCTVVCNRNLVELAVRNFISNGLKYSHPGGRVIVTAECKGARPGIHVSDTGKGIDKKQLESLFKIDRLTRAEGTSGERGSGLGLFLVRQMAVRAGAELKVDSEPGRGSRFSLLLPVNQTS